VEAVTIIEAPPMIVCGMVGYYETPRGLKSCTTAWAQHLSKECKRRFYKNWCKSKEKKAFTRYAKKYTEGNGIADEKEKLLKHCTSLRLLCHTQIQKLNFRQKKAHICEIQVNGGSMADKIAFAEELFEKPVEISSVFQQNEMIDTIAIPDYLILRGLALSTQSFMLRLIFAHAPDLVIPILCVEMWHLKWPMQIADGAALAIAFRKRPNQSLPCF